MPLNADAEQLLNDFGKQPGVGHDHVANLRNVINDSPVLADQINVAVATGHLQRFAVLPAGANAGGSYDGANGTMNLPLSILATPANGSAIDAGEIAFVLGHEVQHGFNHAATTQAYQTFNQGVGQIAKSAAAIHDYTSSVEALIAANRRDEAKAEIAGYNAVVSLARATDPDATLDDVYRLQPGRMADFLRWDSTASPPGYRPHPDLQLNPDMTLAATPGNVEAMGRHYFDKPGDLSGLGHHGDSDYANYYGAYAITVIARDERAYAQPLEGGAPRLTLDMTRLRLSESLVEQNGIDLGAVHTPVPYHDSSSTPPTLHHFDHTAATHAYTPIHGTPAEHAQALDPTHPSHPGYALYRQIADGIGRLDAQLGRVPDEASRQVSAHLYAAARDAGLTQVSQVVPNVETADQRPGERLFAVQGAMDDPLRRIAWIDTAEALRTPSVDAFRRAEAAAPAMPDVVRPPVHEQAPAPAIGAR